MAGPWESSPLFAHSFTKDGIREAVAAIVAGFPGAEFLATERDRVERDWKLPDRLAEIAVPTRVMVGEKEMSGFKAFAEEAAGGIPGATLEVIPDCGHLLPLEAPDAVATMIIGLFKASERGLETQRSQRATKGHSRHIAVSPQRPPSSGLGNSYPETPSLELIPRSPSPSGARHLFV